MPTHRLAAVMFADIVGYTTMMQADEVAGIARASRLREVITTLVPQHGGELIEMRGDGALCVFGSSVEAVRCAQGVQQALSGDVPLRIGLHLGDITQREGHLFGDAVNVASRIEAMGVAGAVLLSDPIRQQVKNKPEIELKPLGKFTFKNVAEPMEVYALAGAGLAMPDPKALGSGSLPKRPRLSLRSAAFIVLGLLLLAVGGWLVYRPVASSPPPTLPPELQQERIAVLPFVNQTGQTDLDMLGNLIADWLTRGLLEQDGATVLNAENLLPLLEAQAYADLSEAEGLPGLRQAAGVAVVIWGDYYQLGDSIVIQTRILETASQQVLSALSTRTTQADLLRGLDALTSKVLSFWAVKDQERFAQNPPAYEAYQTYEKASAIYITKPAQAEQLFWQAYELDSSFLAPLFQLVNLYTKEGKNTARQVVMDQIATHQPAFTQWENNHFRRLQAAQEGKWLLAGRLAEQQFRQDPSDLSAFAAATSHYSKANAPALVLALHQQLDPRFLAPKKKRELNWDYPSLAFSLYQLGRYKAVDSLAKTYDFPLIPDALAVLHLKSLAQLGWWQVWDQQLQKYLEIGVVNTSGQYTPAGQLLPLIGDELYLLGETNRLQALAKELQAWAMAHPNASDYHRSLGYAWFYQGNYARAYQAWQQEPPVSPMLPGWLQISLAVSRISRLAICQARLGDTAAAEAHLAQIEQMTNDHERWPAIQQYYLAQVWTALGETEKALQALKRAVNGGFSFFQPAVYNSDPFLLPLWGNLQFEALVTPRQ